MAAHLFAVSVAVSDSGVFLVVSPGGAKCFHRARYSRAAMKPSSLVMSWFCVMLSLVVDSPNFPMAQVSPPAPMGNSQKTRWWASGLASSMRSPPAKLSGPGCGGASSQTGARAARPGCDARAGQAPAPFLQAFALFKEDKGKARSP